MKLTMLSLIASFLISRCHAQGLAMPAQQAKFCSLFKADDLRHKERATRIAAAKNPIARSLIENEPDTSDRTLEAGEFAVVGEEGAFEQWVGQINVIVDHRRNVFVSIKTPCTWTEHGRGFTVTKNIFFGTGFGRSPALFEEDGIPLESDSATSLAELSPDESVVVSGRLFCNPVNPSNSNGGCQATWQGGSFFRAKITSIHSRKTGAVIQLNKEEQ